jgi:hypothetical protein
MTLEAYLVRIALCCAEQHISPLKNFRELQQIKPDLLAERAGLRPDELHSIERWERPLSEEEANSFASILSVPYYILNPSKRAGRPVKFRWTRTSKVLRVFNFCIIAVLLIYGSNSIDNYSFSPTAVIDVMMLPGIMFLFSVHFLLYCWEWSRKKNIQEMRDDDAFDIFWKARAGFTPPSFVLYLRPFSVTGRMRKRRGLLLNHFAPDVEEQIADLCESKALLLALGLPGETFGGGRLKSSEAKWKNDVDILIDTSSLIIMFPSYRTGTMWEFERIIQRKYMYKTIFLMKPRFVRKAEWTKTRETWKAHFRVELPGWGGRGVFEWVEATARFRMMPLAYVADRLPS